MQILDALDRHGRLTALLPAILIALVLLATACGSGTEEPATAAPAHHPTETAPLVTGQPRPSSPVDAMVDVGPGRLHLRCDGSGDETVVLISGFTGSVESWASIWQDLAATTRVCAYDRFGTGTSDQPATIQTFGTQARDLEALLTEAGEVGPYVLVGHSFGGAEAVMFSSLFPSDVQGLLLVEASPASWGEVICTVGADGSAGADGFRQACAMQARPEGNPERLDGPAAFAEVAAVSSLGALPTIVATAPNRRSGTAGLPTETVAALDEAWHAGQEHWASLSTRSHLLVVDGSGHDMQVDRPDVLLDQIRQLLARPAR